MLAIGTHLSRAEQAGPKAKRRLRLICLLLLLPLAIKSTMTREK